MSSVLIVDDDATLRDSLAREVRAWGFDVFVEGSAEAALTLLHRCTIDVMVTDLRMGGLDGIDLIRAARLESPKTQTLLMSAFATARDQQLATEHGTVRVLCKPFTPAQLRHGLREALDSRQGFRGVVHGLSLLDMLQLFHLSRRSVTLTIGGKPPGHVHFDKCEIVHATYGAYSGRDALLHILRNESGTISSSMLEPQTPRTISSSFEGMLVHLLSQIDEDPQRAREDNSSLGYEEVDDDAAWAKEFAAPSQVESASVSVPAGEGTASLDDGEEENYPESNMAEIDEACQRVVQETDGGIACGVVDLDTGMLLGVFNNAGYSQSLNEIVAAACVDMFRGSNVNRVNQAVRAHRGIPEDGEHYFEEILVTSKRNYHFMKTVRGGKAVVVLVTHKSASVGLGWAMLKAMVPSVEPFVP